MAVLSKRAAATQPWRWEATEQRAFAEIKDIVSKHRNSNRVALDYSPGAPPINLTTDACCTGASGVVSQGADLKTAKIAAFWSGKFTATQQNYPVHEQELLAIKESLERFKNLLQGVRVNVYTDHKALIYFQTQQKLSARQTRWMEKINEFDTDVKYIPGESNVLADALSRMYSNEPEGVVRHKSEYVTDTDHGAPDILVGAVRRTGLSGEEITEPLNVGDGIRAELETRLEQTENAPRRSQREHKQNMMYANQPQRKRRTVKKDVPDPQNAEESPSPGAAGQTTQPESSTRVEPSVTRNEAEASLFDEDNAEEKTTHRKPKIEAGLETTLTECVTEFKLPDSLVGRYKEDAALNHIASEPDQYRNFVMRNDVLYLRRDDLLLLCVPDVKVGKRSVREVLITHAHSILAHLGTRKTLAWLRTQVWWKTMVEDVRAYCETCGVCAANKPSTQRPMGLLQAMPVPSYPWQSIGVDFVGPLPESKTRSGTFDMITTVIDNLTRMVHLIPTRQEYTAKDIAEVIFEHVYKLHGMPERIVSDRDSLFTSTFWTRINELSKTELRMSSSYHPQTDGMTERVQRTYTGLLRMCAGRMQKEWAENLPAIEFAVNSARSEATGLSPFYLNYGRTPSMRVTDTDSKFPGVREHVERIKLAIMTAHDALIEARAKMTRQANKHRRRADIAEGALVYVSTQNMRLPKGQARKLAPKFVGPYKVARVLTQGASFEIDLPKEMRARGIHPVFHASLLRLHVPSDDRRFPGREFQQVVTLGDTPQEWAVDRILSHKGKGRKAIFQLKWKTGDTTWEPYRIVRHLEALDAYCEAQGVANIGKLEVSPGDIDGSEPEDYELNHLRLIFDSGEEYKKAGGDDEDDPPVPPSYSLTQTDSTSDFSDSPSDMSDNPDSLYLQSLRLMLDSQARTNEAMIRMAQTMKDGGRKTHRQRRAQAKKAAEDPAKRGPRANKKGRANRNQTQPQTQSQTHPDLLPLGNDWFGADAAPLTEHDVLSNVPSGSGTLLGIHEAPPVTHYAPHGTGSHGTHTPSTHVSQHAHGEAHPSLPTQPTHATPSHTVPTHSTQITQTAQTAGPSTQNPTDPSSLHQEEIDYEDESMEETGGANGEH